MLDRNALSIIAASALTVVHLGAWEAALQINWDAVLEGSSSTGATGIDATAAAAAAAAAAEAQGAAASVAVAAAPASEYTVAESVLFAYQYGWEHLFYSCVWGNKP